MTTDEYGIKITVDSSQLAMAGQQAAIMASSLAQQAGSLGMGPMSALAQQAYVQSAQSTPVSPFMASMVTPMGTALMDPFQRMGTGNYVLPTGLLAGSVGAEHFTARQSAKTLADVGFDLTTRALGRSLRTASDYLGFPLLGSMTPSAGFGLNPSRLDQPVYRTQMEVAERYGDVMAGMGGNLLRGGLTLGTGALTLGSILGTGGLGIPAGLAAYALGSTVDYAFNAKDSFRQFGRLYSDATATTHRSRLGGGATRQQSADFITGTSKLIDKDDFLFQDDYRNLFETGNTLGFLTATNTPEKTVNALDNIQKNLKSALVVGHKLKEFAADMEQARALGIDLAGSPRAFATNMTAFGVNAFSANMSNSQMLQAAASAGGLYAGQGLAPIIGGRIHSANLALAGEAIRMGSYNVADQAYYGGQTGIANALTQGYATLNRTGLGQATLLASMQNPNFGSLLTQGGGGVNSLINSGALNMSVSDYSNLLYRMPEFSRGLDPNSMGIHQLGAVINSLPNNLRGTDGKFAPGTLAMVLQSMGLPPDQARLMVRQLETAESTTQGQRESLENKAKTLAIETIRPTPTIFSNPRVWFNKQLERIVNPYSSSWAASEERTAGYFEHKYMHGMLGDYLDPSRAILMKSHDAISGESFAKDILYQQNQGRGLANLQEAKKSIDSDIYRLTEANVIKALNQAVSKDGKFDTSLVGTAGQEVLAGRSKANGRALNMIGLYENYNVVPDFVDLPSNITPFTQQGVTDLIKRLQRNPVLSSNDEAALIRTLQQGGPFNQNTIQQIKKALTSTSNLTSTEKHSLVNSVMSKEQLILTAQGGLVTGASSANKEKSIVDNIATLDPDVLKKAFNKIASTKSDKDLILESLRVARGDSSLTEEDLNRALQNTPDTIRDALFNTQALADNQGAGREFQSRLDKIKNYKSLSGETTVTRDALRKYEDLSVSFNNSLKQAGFNKTDYLTNAQMDLAKASAGAELARVGAGGKAGGGSLEQAAERTLWAAKSSNFLTKGFIDYVVNPYLKATTGAGLQNSNPTDRLRSMLSKEEQKEFDSVLQSYGADSPEAQQLYEKYQRKFNQQKFSILSNANDPSLASYSANLDKALKSGKGGAVIDSINALSKDSSKIISNAEYVNFKASTDSITFLRSVMGEDADAEFQDLSKALFSLDGSAGPSNVNKAMSKLANRFDSKKDLKDTYGRLASLIKKIQSKQIDKAGAEAEYEQILRSGGVLTDKTKSLKDTGLLGVVDKQFSLLYGKDTPSTEVSQAFLSLASPQVKKEAGEDIFTGNAGMLSSSYIKADAKAGIQAGIKETLQLSKALNDLSSQIQQIPTSLKDYQNSVEKSTSSLAQSVSTISAGANDFSNIMKSLAKDIGLTTKSAPIKRN